jgi:hypothetical protein
MGSVLVWPLSCREALMLLHDRGRPGEERPRASLAGDASSIPRRTDTGRPRRRIEVEFVNASCAYVRGYGSREILTDLRGRPPVYARLSRAWCCLPSTARDVIAIAESRNYLVVVSGDQVVGRRGDHHLDPQGGDHHDLDPDQDERLLDPGRGLW